MLLAAALVFANAFSIPNRGPLDLRLEPKSQTIRDGQKATFKIEIRNVSETVQTIVKIRDGSFEHRVTPLVGWSALDADWKSHPGFPDAISGWCGNVNPLREEDLVELKPGQSLALTTFGHVDPRPGVPGNFRVRFYYQNDPTKRYRKELILGIEPPELLLRLSRSTACNLVSNEVTITVVPD